MAQFLKEEVAQEIARAALRVFAARGYRAASMADIAREAGISTGNVYRYFDNKEVLFAQVVPLSLQTRFLSLLKGRVRSSGQAGFAEAAQALTEFSLTHRLELVIMLGRAEDTPHQGFAGSVRSVLETMALAHFGVDRPSGPLAFTLREVYVNFVSTMVISLREHEDASSIRAAVDKYARYHWAGLHALFEGGNGESSR